MYLDRRPGRPIIECHKLGSSVRQPLGHMRPVVTSGDLRFEAGDLICECPPSEFDGSVPVRIHESDAIGAV
jgi:hypothetical protein